MMMIMKMMMVIMMMNMMMKIKMVITRLIIELGAPNFVWQQVQIIPTDDDNDHVDDDVNYDDKDDDSDNDDKLDYEDQNGNTSANFQARSSRFCMVKIQKSKQVRI